MSFGAFMEGLQGGIGTGQNMRRQRQLDEIYDAGIRKIKTEEGLQRKEYGDAVASGDAEPGLEFSDFMTGDPVWQRIVNAIGGKKKAPVKAALPVGDTPSAAIEGQTLASAPETDAYYAEDGIALADGRRPIDVDSPEEIEKRAAANRARNPARVSGTETVRAQEPVGPDKPSAAQKAGARVRTAGRQAIEYGKNYEGLGVDKMGGVTGKEGAVRRTVARGKGLAKGAGVGYLAGQTISGAIDAYNTPTEDMAGELGLNYNDRPDGLLGVGYDALVRTGGTMRRVGDAILSPFTGGETPAPAPAPAALPVAPDTRKASGPTTRGGATPRPAAVPPASAVPANPATPTKPEEIDFSQMDPMEVPDFKTRDWQEYRRQAVRGLIGRGIPAADAIDKVDQQVVGMQMRGFTTFANQGMALQQAGDVKGAAAAYRAAFQYFPTTTDVRFATVKGQLVAYGVDEDTGEPVGKPWVVNPETLSVAMQNFSTPGAWAAHAQDRDRIDVANRQVDVAEGQLGLARDRLRQVEIPATQALMDQRAVSARADLLKAKGGGEGGLKPSDMRAGDQDARDVINRFMLAADQDGNPRFPKLQDPAYQQQTLIEAQQLFRAAGQQVPLDAIILALLAVESPAEKQALFKELAGG